MPPTRLTYRQIADDLEDRIRRGEYQPGSRLPSYRQIGEAYSCGTTTAQSAVRELRARGLVEGRQGVAVFVVDDLPT